MAVLTRPLFHAQERIDLEDFNQILSGLRTDSRLWVRQVYADKNFILKGFEATGINTNQLSVNIFDSTMLFAGRQDLTGTATITIGSSTVVSTPTVVTIFNADGNQLTFTSSDTVDSGTNWLENSDVAVSATSLARAINTITGLEAMSSGGAVTITTTNVGFTNITATPQTTGFITTVGDIIGTFDYSANVVESPGDLSYFIVQSSVTGAAGILTSEITAGQRAPSTAASKTLSVYMTLTTASGTPITKAFWDPSANGGSGGEFNQRVNTATDLVVAIDIRDGAIDPTSADFFARVPVCDIDVDSSGTIIAIRDVRPLLFEADDNFVLNQTTPFVTIGLRNSVTNFTPTATINNNVFVDGETVNITDGDGTTVRASAVLTAVVGAPPNDQLTLEKFDLAQAPARQRLAVGVTSGAIRIVDSVSSNFFRDDKSLGNFRDTISAIATEIRKIKGTTRWYENPSAALEDVLRFINSSIVSKNDFSRFVWSGTNLQLVTSPTFTGDVTFNLFGGTTGIESGDTIVFGGQTFTASSTLNTVNNFLLEVDVDRIAENFAAAVNRNTATNFGLTGIRASVDPINRAKIDLTTDAATLTPLTIVVTVNRAGSVSSTAFTSNIPADPNLAAVRIYGHSGSFNLQTFDIPVEGDEVLFITLPDLETTPTASSTVTGASPFRFSQSGPVNMDDTRNAAWNTTERARFQTDTTIFKTAPIVDFERNARNYWIAFRESGTNILHIRGVGEVGANEVVNIGEGISNQTLSYIGAPNETTSTPTYASVATIDAFRTSTVTEGAYTTGNGAEFNFNEIGATDSLTLALSNVNDHLVSLRDTQYQNRDIRLVDGGFFSWDIVDGQTVNGNLTWSSPAFISVPGLNNNTNTIAATTSTGFSIPDGSVLYVDINRTQLRTSPAAQTILPVVDTQDAFVPQRDRFIMARRVGQFLYLGVGSSMRIGDGESSPVDGELSYFGLSGDQLPRQLNTKPQGTNAVDISNGDIRFRVGGLATQSTTDDDFVVLTTPIGTGVAFWEGATFDFSGVPVSGSTYTAGQGKILTEGSSTDQPFRSRDAQTGTNTRFDIVSLTASQEVWYTVGLSGDTTIVAADPEITTLNAIALAASPPIAPVIGRLKGEPVVTGGTAAASGMATIPEFGGSLPVMAFRVRRNSAGTANENITAGDILVLGGGAGGGGGSGDASSNLDLLLDRFNIAPYQYVSPLVASIDALGVLDADNGNDVGVAQSSYAFTPGDDLVTIDLLDNDFKTGSQTLSKIEVMGLWGEDNDVVSIDPNARYFITQDPANLTVLETNVTTHPITPTLVDAIGNANATLGTITSIDHGLETGQRVVVAPVGFTIGASTNEIVRRVDADTITLHGTIADAEANTNILAITITTGTIGGTITRQSGIISRLDQSGTVRSSFVFPNVLRSASVTITNVAAAGQTIILTTTSASPDSFTLAGASTTAIATNLAALITANANYSAVVDSTNTSRVLIYREGDLDSLVITGTALASNASKTDFVVTPSMEGLRLRIQADNNGTFAGNKLLAAVGIYYAFDEGFEGALNGTNDVVDLLRDNHLGAGTVANEAAYSLSSPGRGILLKDNSAGDPLLELAFNNGQLSVRASDGTFIAIAARDAEGNLLVP